MDTPTPPIAIRRAAARDASDAIVLADIAGYGLPSWLWSQALARGEAESTLGYGRSRILRESGDFSLQNTWMAFIEECPAGLLLGYRLPDESVEPDVSDLDPILAPLVELEAEAPATWYVNILAVYPEFRGRGVAASLLEKAEYLGLGTAARGLSLIVQDDNDNARRVYERAGYQVTSQRTFVPFPGASAARNWLLMVKTLQ